MVHNDTRDKVHYPEQPSWLFHCPNAVVPGTKDVGLPRGHASWDAPSEEQKSHFALDLFAQGNDRIQQTMYTALTTIQVALIDTARASAIASPLVFVH